MAELLFNTVLEEQMGHLYPCKLKLTNDDIHFKNAKTGKTVTINKENITDAEVSRSAKLFCLCIKTISGRRHTFQNFSENDIIKLQNHFSEHFVEIKKINYSVKGWNWGKCDFVGNALEFSVENKRCMDIPLEYVGNTTFSKNEVVMQFHQNEDTECMLTEMRMHIPDVDGENKSEEFYQNILDRADVIQATSDFLCMFNDIQCLQPRGHYEVKVYPTFLHMHGKSFDFKISKSMMVKLMLLPHPDGHQVFLLIQVDPPIKSGQTRYHFVIFLFSREDHSEVELSCSEDWIKENYPDSKLTKVIEGAEYEVVAKLLKRLYNQKLVSPGDFETGSGENGLSACYKASSGLLYPLDKGLIFIPKPTIWLRYDEIAFVAFHQPSVLKRSFDIDVEATNGVVYSFKCTDAKEFETVYNFLKKKNLRIKSTQSAADIQPEVNEWSGSEESRDAYLEKVKCKGERRNEQKEEESESDEEDEDFKPPEGSGDSDIAEEYDSNANQSSSDEEEEEEEKKAKKSSDLSDLSDGVAGEAVVSKKIKSPEIKEKKERKQRMKKEKRKKDKNAPKRPLSAYFLFLADHREETKAKLGEAATVSAITKALSVEWGKLDDSKKAHYNALAAKKKEEYDRAVAEYEAKRNNMDMETS